MQVYTEPAPMTTRRRPQLPPSPEDLNEMFYQGYEPGEPINDPEPMPSQRKEETPLQATYRRAAEEGDSWTWTPKVEGCLDVMLCRTASHAKNPDLKPYEVTLFTCDCPVGRQGKLCKHGASFRKEFGPAIREAQLEAAGGPSTPASCRRCLSTGKIGPRHFCSCSVGQALVQSSNRRRRVAVA